MKPLCWIMVASCIAASPVVQAESSDERVISLAEIVEAHKEPVRVGNAMVEMELNNCLLSVTTRPIKTCNRAHVPSNVGARKVTVAFDLREVWRMRISNLDMPGADNLNNNSNIVSVSGINPDNSDAFSQEFEKCDGTITRSENGTGFGFPITAISDGFFRGIPIEFDSDSCLIEGS